MERITDDHKRKRMIARHTGSDGQLRKTVYGGINTKGAYGFLNNGSFNHKFPSQMGQLEEDSSVSQPSHVKNLMNIGENFEKY
jgi:hypothetical protein